jgi:hypothetical protein
VGSRERRTAEAIGRSGVGTEREPGLASAKRTWSECTGPLGVGTDDGGTERDPQVASTVNDPQVV